MNQNASLEGRLEALGAALRARPRLIDRVMGEVLESTADGSTEGLPTLGTPTAPRRRWRLVAVSVSTVATVAVAVSIVLLLFPSPSVGWADVTKAIQSQKWIRGTVTFSNGDRGTMWLSPERQIWAFGSERFSQFFDGRKRAKYEYHGGSGPITKLPLGEEDARRVLPLDALSEDKEAIGPWLFGTEKIVDQKRREVREADKTWIEFQMVLWRGDMNQATLRVDPKTRLPVYLLVASPEDEAKSIKWQFDYPAHGPTDIYALGVAPEVKIDDQMPSGDVQTVLDAMAASRARIADFRLIVARRQAGLGYQEGSIVWRKGNRWRVDSCLSRRPLSEPEDGQSLKDWFADFLEDAQQVPLYVCDGKTVYESSIRRGVDGDKVQWEVARHPAPQDLMSSDGIFERGLSLAPYVKLVTLAYPDLTPIRGWGFEVDPHPSDAPGCVLIKRWARLTRKEPWKGHEWFYIDPSKGHAVVRAELFNLPADTPASPEAASGQTILVEDFQQGPNGFWYPTVVHDTMSVVLERNDGGEISSRHTTTVRYCLELDADLPDSLFTIDEAQERNK